MSGDNTIDIKTKSDKLPFQPAKDVRLFIIKNQSKYITAGPM